MNRLTLTVLAATAATGLLVGCNSKTPGDATSAPPTGGDTSTPTSTSSTGDDGEAPRVAGPELSLEKFKVDSCSLLKPEQIAQLGDMEPGEKRDRSGQPQCIWHPTASTGKFSYTFTLSKSTLADFYEKAKPQYPSFKATTVAGYPGASYDGLGGASGDCTSVVALSNTAGVLMVQVNMSTPTAENYRTPCKVSENGAESRSRG